MSSLKSRAEQNAVFIVRESLRALRLHMATLESDTAAVDRIIKEADILSGALRKWLPYVVASEERRAFANSPPLPRDMDALMALHDSLAAVQFDTICATCGGIKSAPEAPRATAGNVDATSREGAMRSVAAADRHS